MTMTKDQFEAQVAKFEGQALRDPVGYRRRTVLLALLGNVYLGAMLLLAIGLFLGSLASILILKGFAAKPIAFAAGFLWLLLSALWVRLKPPQGLAVDAREAPQLFAMINDLRRQLDAPALHRVLITEDFNAGVAQLPRFGAFGTPRNYLLLGLPLMKALSVPQFQAVLAHEFGHLARGDARVSSWIYLQRIRWMRLMTLLEESRSKGRFLVTRFLNWYAPYLNAYSFPMARADEYRADATAARLTAPATMAEALVRSAVAHRHLDERFWPSLHKQADELPQPGFMPYASMGTHVATELDPPSAAAWLEQAMAAKTTLDDTHPALAERLRALGQAPRLAPPEPGQAADQLLGAGLARLTDAFDQRWLEAVRPSWQQHHQEIQEKRKRLMALDAQHKGGGELSLQDAIERALLTESIGADADAALEQFRALHERATDNAVLCFHLGAGLLSRMDASGCALVEQAIKVDPDAVLAAGAVLRDYFQRLGDETQALAWHRRMVDRSELLQAAELERSTIDIKEKLLAHDLPQDQLAQLRAQLERIAGLRKAYLLKKPVQHLPDHPCYVLGFTVPGLFWFQGSKRAADVGRRIAETVTFPARTLIISVQGEHYRFGRKFRWMRGARIH